MSPTAGDSRYNDKPTETDPEVASLLPESPLARKKKYLLTSWLNVQKLLDEYLVTP